MRKRLVIDYLEDAANEYRDKTAVICEEDRISYGDLFLVAKRIGSTLHKELGGARNEPVMIFMDKNIPHVIAIYAVLMSGNVYVPMDIKTPLERLKRILKTMGTEHIIATADKAALLKEMGYEGKVFIYEDLIENRKEADDGAEDILAATRREILDNDLMYLLFTSGSTGEPKGVAVRHRSVADYIEAFIGDTGLDEKDIIGNQTPFYADMSLKDLMALYIGATLVIIPQKFFMTPKKLLGYLDEHKVTTIMWVPTAYRIVSQFDGLSKIYPRSLHRFVFSGETMPMTVIRYWMSHYRTAECEYIQQYGPTEITGACTAYHVKDGDEKLDIIPIGKPFMNTGIVLLDEKGGTISPPEGGGQESGSGEICVFGTCLAAGYYNDSDHTNEKFVQNPLVTTHKSLMYRTGDLGKYDADGNLVFISRMDEQVKHGGKRIELGEIERAAADVKGVTACCCIHNEKEDKLILYYQGEATPKEAKEGISVKLPKYMVPTIYRQVDELPTLPNGKLNRKKLKEMEGS